MRVSIDPDPEAMGARAARLAAEGLRRALAARGRATLVLATAPSQATLHAALARSGPDWPSIEIFHLDEYIGLGAGHPASFAGLLQRGFLPRLPAPPKAFHAVDGQADPGAECRRLAALLATRPVDVACIGIGENGHVAFNDPPADFRTAEAYIPVSLDLACRRQQTGEGWFPTVEDVPPRALSMTVRQILSAARVVCAVPDARKARAVRDAVEGPLGPDCPASALRAHPDCHLCLDAAAAGMLSPLFSMHLA